MKIIPKMQMGGKSPAQFASFTPFIPQLQQLAAPAQLLTSSASSSSSSGAGIPKELTSLLNNLDGLPNEMALLSLQVAGLMESATLFGSLSGLGMLSSQYALIQAAIKTANWNKKEYDKAYNQVVKNHGLNEVAINEDGSIFAFDKDKKLVNISILEYLKNKDKYVPQTNSNLLWLRAKDPQFIDNNLILNTVSNGIGMKEVVAQINLNLKTLGSSTEELNGYVKKTGSQVESGIAALLLLANSGLKASIDGIYKVKSKNTNSLKLMEAAISAIYQSLTPNAQALLMLKSGDAKNPTKAALNLISLKVMQIMNNTITYDETYDHNFDETGKPIPRGKSGSGDDKDDFKQNAAMMFLNGTGYTQEVEMNLGGNDSRTITAVTNVIPGSDNKPFEGQYLSELGHSGMAGVLDLKNASMGGYKVAIADQVQLANNLMHLIWWPANADGTPNLDAADPEALRQANSEIAQKQLNPDSPEAQAIMEKYGINDIQNLKLFVVIDAITSNKALGVNRFDSTPLLETVSDAVASNYEEAYKSYWSKDKAKARSMDLDHFHWLNPNDWFGGYDDIYKGLVWIPVMGHWANAMAGTGEHVKTQDIEDYNNRLANYDADIRAQQQYINPADYE